MRVGKNPRKRMKKKKKKIKIYFPNFIKDSFSRTTVAVK